MQRGFVEISGVRTREELRGVRRVIGALPGQQMAGSGSLMRHSRPIRQFADQTPPRSPTHCPQPNLTVAHTDCDPDVRHHVDPNPNPDACRRSLMHVPRYWRRYDAFWRSAPLSSPNRKYPPLSADPPPRRPLPQPNLSLPALRCALFSAALLRGPTRGGDARVRRALRGRGPSHP